MFFFLIKKLALGLESKVFINDPLLNRHDAFDREGSFKKKALEPITCHLRDLKRSLTSVDGYFD